ncbi:MAG: hypothetical protein M1834_008004 [Cirrosporium novae-zelandiae]|nr:MAG: hypothetical protein M1834_008004 [Cirrosporium novae-zelandiae]
MASKQFNVAVIGYGLSAKIFHIPFVTTTPGLKLYAVVQRHPKPEDDAEKDHPGIKSYRSAEEMVKDPAVDLVIVSTTPNIHFEQTKLALEAGKHVVVEKPFCSTSKECDELIAIAKKNQKLLTVYQNRRWDADFLTLSKLIKEGKFGRIVDFETHFDRHRPEAKTGTWKNEPIPGGGVIYDLGTHLIDQVVVTFGLPKKITAFIEGKRSHNETNFEDSFTALLHYDGGLVATAKASVISPEVNQLRYWIRGEKGGYKKFHLDCQESQLRKGIFPDNAAYAKEPSELWGTLTTAEGDKITSEVYPTIEGESYSTYYSIIAKALAGQGDVPVKPEEASSVIRLIELAQESSKTGKTLTV